MARTKRRRGTRRGRGKRAPKFSDSGITKASFSSQMELNFDNGTGKVEVDLFPHAVGFCARFSDMSYLFTYYRIVSLEYMFVPTTTRVSNEVFAHAVLPTDDGALVLGSFGQLAQMPQCKMYDARMITLQRNVISRGALMRQPTKWWSTTDSGNTKSDFVQASLVAISSQGAVSNTLQVLFKFVVEFTGAAIDGASVTERVEAHDPPNRRSELQDEIKLLELQLDKLKLTVAQ